MDWIENVRTFNIRGFGKSLNRTLSENELGEHSIPV